MTSQLNFVIRTLHVLIGACLLLAACEQPEPSPQPLARFSFSPNNIPAPAEIQFADESENARSLTWNFGDDSPACSEINPRHTYLSEGSYTVELTALGEDGSLDVARQTVTVLRPPLPVASFTMSAETAEAPAEITFTNTSEFADTYLWTFGDGSSSALPSTKHVFASPGTYTILLTATGYGGSSSVSKALVVTVPVNIFPGKGAGGFSLAETWASVLAKLKSRNLSYTQYGPILLQDASGAVIIHPVEVPALGMWMYFLSLKGSFTFDSADVVFLLSVESPYQGLTPERVGLGSSLDDLRSAYGSPEQHDTKNRYYRYPSLGINFRYATDNSVNLIALFTKSTKNGRVQDADEVIRSWRQDGIRGIRVAAGSIALRGLPAFAASDHHISRTLPINLT
jgi:PKD repeat protein